MSHKNTNWTSLTFKVFARDSSCSIVIVAVVMNLPPASKWLKRVLYVLALMSCLFTSIAIEMRFWRLSRNSSNYGQIPSLSAWGPLFIVVVGNAKHDNHKYQSFIFFVYIVIDAARNDLPYFFSFNFFFQRSLEFK